MWVRVGDVGWAVERGRRGPCGPSRQDLGGEPQGRTWLVGARKTVGRRPGVVETPDGPSPETGEGSGLLLGEAPWVLVRPEGVRESFTPRVPCRCSRTPVPRGVANRREVDEVVDRRSQVVVCKGR